MPAIHSEGICLFCSKTFPKKTISLHLSKHISETQKTAKAGKSFHLRIEPTYCFPEMFINLWVNGNCKIDTIDFFLRQIWLECCGHMSSFIDPRKKKSARGMMFNLSFDEDNFKVPGEINKNVKAEKVFVKGLVLDYEYDFGSTTNLKIKVIEEFQFAAPKPLTLLSRNEPLELLCDICHKETAVDLCCICIGEEEGLFCKKCAKKHEKECSDFSDYAKMPVVNSPRMGVCGYEGGDIDTDRDHAFCKPK